MTTERLPAVERPPFLVDRFENTTLAASVIGRPLNGRRLYWSLPELENKPLETSERQEITNYIAQEAHRNQVHLIAVPRVDRFNAGITTVANLNRDAAEDIGNGVALIRGDDESFFHDGVVLEPGEGAAMVTGDCHTIVAWSPDCPQIIAAHAGRNSLHTLENEHRNDSPSVVNTLVEHMHVLGAEPSSIHLHLMAGIGRNSFTHALNDPMHGDRSRRLVPFFAQYGAADENDSLGRIDVATAIRAQCVALGVPDSHITQDGLDTATNDRLWSNRNTNKERNVVLVLNKPR